jgi:hypothetical protein
MHNSLPVVKQLIALGANPNAMVGGENELTGAGLLWLAQQRKDNQATGGYVRQYLELKYPNTGGPPRAQRMALLTDKQRQMDISELRRYYRKKRVKAFLPQGGEVYAVFYLTPVTLLASIGLVFQGVSFFDLIIVVWFLAGLAGPLWVVVRAIGDLRSWSQVEAGAIAMASRRTYEKYDFSPGSIAKPRG